MGALLFASSQGSGRLYHLSSAGQDWILWESSAPIRKRLLGRSGVNLRVAGFGVKGLGFEGFRV